MEGCPPSFSRHPERVALELLFWGNRVTSENELDPVNFVFWYDLKKSRGATFKTRKSHSLVTLFPKSHSNGWKRLAMRSTASRFGSPDYCRN